MEFNVVILNWNAREDTVASVRRLDGWTAIEPRIWVVDNGSVADESAAIERECPAVTLLRSERNLGFSGGTNLALRQIVGETSKPVLLLNNDVRIEEDVARALLDTLAREPRCALVSPVIVDAAHPDRVLSAGGSSPLLRRDHTLRSSPPGQPLLYPVDFVSGAAVLIRVSVLQQVGLLDEAFFFGLELADLCRRARAAGHLCLVDSSLRAEHDLARSSGLRETLYVYYAVRNRMLYARRALPGGWPVPVAFWALYGLQQGVRLWLKGRRRTATAILLGVGDGLRGRFGDRNERVLRACGARAAQTDGVAR